MALKKFIWVQSVAASNSYGAKTFKFPSYSGQPKPWTLEWTWKYGAYSHVETMELAAGNVLVDLGWMIPFDGFETNPLAPMKLRFPEVNEQ